MTGKLSGGCHCGQVHYSCETEALNTMLCHCTDCQKFTGSAFSTLVVVPKDQFHIEGKLSQYGAQGDGEKKYKYACENCGVAVYGEVTAVPHVLVVFAGTLDDEHRRAVQPKGHIFTRSMVPWLKLEDDLPRFEMWMKSS
jgi:hypothetical protein